jgi:hypothetical protein
VKKQRFAQPKKVLGIISPHDASNDSSHTHGKKKRTVKLFSSSPGQKLRGIVLHHLGHMMTRASIHPDTLHSFPNQAEHSIIITMLFKQASKVL